MRPNTKFSLTFVGLFAITIFSGCGSSGGGGGSTATTTQSPRVAVSTVGAAFSSFSNAGGSTENQKLDSALKDASMTDVEKMRSGIKGYGFFLQKQATFREKISFAATTVSCTGGGTLTTDLDETGFNGTVTATNCIQGDSVNNTTFVFETLSTQECFGFTRPLKTRTTSNGMMSFGTSKITFSNLVSITDIPCFDLSDENFTFNFTLESGSVSITDSTSPEEDVDATYQGLVITSTSNGTEASMTMNGKMSVTLACTDTLNLNISTTNPIVTQFGDVCPISGTLVLSGDIDRFKYHL